MNGSALSLRRCVALGFVTLLAMLPETLPVPVLRALVVERFHVSGAAASWFMAANLVGALLVSPFLGPWVDRRGRRRRLAVTALLLDAVLMQAMAHPLDYASMLALRTAEGAAHITALTLVMSLVADAAGLQRGRALGCLGAGLTFGVAFGAALGGRLGKHDPLLTLHAASAVLLAAGALAAWLLPADTEVGQRPGLRAQLAAVRAEPRMRAPLLLAFVERFTVGFFTTGFPLLLAGVYQTPPDVIGKLLAAFLIPFAALSWPFGRLAETWSRPLLVGGGSLVYGCGVCLVGFTPVPLLWWLMPLLGVASAVMFVPTLLWLLERAPGVGRTTAMAAFHGAGSLGFLLGTLGCGALVRLGGEHGPGYVLAYVCAGASVIVGAGLVFADASRTRR
jgi:MFS transporter, DHA1 family, tetracycline resistance protein